jgi:hypothetical protein
MKNYQEAKEQLDTVTLVDHKLKQIYEWVKTGVIDYKTFIKILNTYWYCDK